MASLEEHNDQLVRRERGVGNFTHSVDEQTLIRIKLDAMSVAPIFPLLGRRSGDRPFRLDNAFSGAPYKGVRRNEQVARMGKMQSWQKV